MLLLSGNNNVKSHNVCVGVTPGVGCRVQRHNEQKSERATQRSIPLADRLPFEGVGERKGDGTGTSCLFSPLASASSASHWPPLSFSFHFMCPEDRLRQCLFQRTRVTVRPVQPVQPVPTASTTVAAGQRDYCCTICQSYTHSVSQLYKGGRRTKEAAVRRLAAACVRLQCACSTTTTTHTDTFLVLSTLYTLLPLFLSLSLKSNVSFEPSRVRDSHTTLGNRDIHKAGDSSAVHTHCMAHCTLQIIIVKIKVPL